MVIAKIRVHIICGVCGQRDYFKYKIEENIIDDGKNIRNGVMITCENCSTVTGLDEIITEEKDV